MLVTALTNRFATSAASRAMWLGYAQKETAITLTETEEAGLEEAVVYTEIVSAELGETALAL